jgi:hypothetical protein
LSTAWLSLVFVVAFTAWPAVSGNAQSKSTDSYRPEEIEWTWEVRPIHPESKLPNVLLVGDSISRNYYPEVQRSLHGVANVYLLATSTSVGDPRLPQQLAEFVAMENVHFRVVHFNNGMHGWAYSEEEYRQAFPAFLASIRAMDPGASLVWANTTPVKTDLTGGATNDRINARNAIALAIVSGAHIAVDDQHALMLKHLDTYQDAVHFNDSGSRVQGGQAAESIRRLLY